VAAPAGIVAQYSGTRSEHARDEGGQTVTPSEDRRGDTLPGPDPGPPPEAVTGVVRVSRRREQAAAAAAPAAPEPVEVPASDGPGSHELGSVTFATVWRGYDTAAVDAYVRRVSRALTELEETRTPQDVVRRALDRVGEETAAILREAEEAAQRITTKSRSDAADRVQKADREAHEITLRARARLRELDADIDRIWIERQRIIDDTRKLADGLALIADHAEERFPAEELELPSGPSPAGEEPDAKAEAAAGRNGGAATPAKLAAPGASGRPAADDAAANEPPAGEPAADEASVEETG
jgi:DivIVA domain-containing protein